jgi:hypothetical protein
MKKIIIIIMLFIFSVGLLGCSKEIPICECPIIEEAIITFEPFEPKGQFTVEVIEIWGSGFYTVKKTPNYSIGGIWGLYTEVLDFELGDEVVVTWYGNEWCVPFVEYADQTFDGYYLGKNIDGNIEWVYINGDKI